MKVLPPVYGTLRTEFQVPQVVSFRLGDIDAVDELELAHPREVAAFTMRKVQLLHYLAKPGVTTTNDTVVALCMDIVRALSQLAGHCSAAAAINLRVAIDGLLDCGVAVGSVFPPGTMGELV